MAKVGGIDDPVWTEGSPPTAVKHRSLWRSALLTVLVVAGLLLLVYPPAAALASRKSFGTFAFWAAPNRVDYCGRRYYESGSETGSPAQFTSQGRGQGAVWERVAWTYSGRSIYGVSQPTDRPGLCTMVLYTPAGHDRWDVYPLSGGP